LISQPAYERLQRLADRLREQTGASRTTVRARAGDDPVALLAESLAPGVESMADGQQPAAIVAAPTYLVLSQTRTILVQDDCVHGGPEPPRSLIERYRVRAPMLAPVLDGETMAGTISVHQPGREADRRRTDREQQPPALPDGGGRHPGRGRRRSPQPR